ncbi:D-alanine--D-serine ligase VanG [Paenibacillus sp. ACRRX]|uniref:D-alanine--D-serine ligase VanG n=1 Tax=Paenibacillus sp. ACRRX TaxID=2918206 RepID=UPI001EF5E0B5|nr:D-alanine--D-serine ligase VanG [Paenibacillus sp. ACRRX]MCG7406560.1 D-alanine--D-serine ligase VanG [Paenibacillus sp. ACRRX]
MEKLTVVVLFGGCSNEYEVSLISAASVIEHMDSDKYELVLVGITREGEWLRYSGSLADIRDNQWHLHPSCIPSFLSPSRSIRGLIEIVNTEYHVTPIDVVFPVMHGKYGEDGTVQGLIELAGIPYVGCDMLSSAICMDKDIAHALVQASGVNTPYSVTMYKGDHEEEGVQDLQALKYPVYVKPAKSGSSIGITKAHDISQLMQGIKLAYEHDHKVVIEEEIKGFEVGCAVLGHRDPMIGVVDEIELIGDFFDFTEKYSLQSSKIHLPARVDAPTADRIKKIARQIYKTLGCKGFARVDMFVTPDGSIVFNEVNTIPGFTSNSRYPKMLQASGYTYSQILDQLIQLAVAEGL